MAEPKLRFKDEQGREYPEWKRQKLGNIFVQTNNYSTLDDKKELYSLTVENGITPKTERYDRSFLVKKNDKFKIVHKNEFVYNPMNMTIGAVGYNNLRKDIIVSGYYVVMKSNNVSTNEYWYNWLKSPKTIRLFKQKATGSLIEKQRIQFSTFEKIKADIPSLPEQQKIADFLTSYDRMIDTQSQRVEAMKTRKKGLLQKIFSQEIRFKDEQGRDYHEWENNMFGNVIQRKSKTALSTNDLPGVEYEDIISGSGRLNKNIYEKQNGKKGIVFSKGDVLYGKLRPYLKNWLLPNFHGVAIGDFWVLSSSLVIAPFLYYFVQSDTFAQVTNTFIGTKMPRADWKLVQAMIIKIPSLSEQQKIADFLTAVDAQIEVEEKRLETMKTIKKGLLQQMFI